MQNSFPKSFVNKTILVYIFGLFCLSIFFTNYIMNIEWLFAGIVSVVCFFYFSNTLPRKWAKLSTKKFTKQLFWYIVLFRFLWMFIFYGYTMLVWNTPWEMPAHLPLDSPGYFNWGNDVFNYIKRGELIKMFSDTLNGVGQLDDLGYPICLGLVRTLFGDSILATRFVNPFFDAWAAVLLYRLATRNFGENVGRLSAVFIMLMPIVFYYSGITMKESVMVMFCVWFLERTDFMIRDKKISIKNIISPLLLVGSLFFFRSSLALVAIMSLLGAILFTHGKVIGWQKRILIAFFVISVASVIFGGYMIEQMEQTLVQREYAGEMNLQHRAERGNKLAGRLSEIVFAPIIFTIPFPTMVHIEDQPIQQLTGGGYYIKNILSFFCILSMFLLLRKSQWRKYAVSILFMCGYLVVVAFSPFAHSGRFHMPAVPMELMFAAFAVCNITKKQAKWFDYFLVLEFLIIIFWNLFKLAGREII